MAPSLTQADVDLIWSSPVSRIPGQPTSIKQDNVDGTTAAQQANTKLDTTLVRLAALDVKVGQIGTPVIDYDLLAQKIYALQQAHGGISDIDVDRITDGVLDRMSVRLAQ